MNHDDIPAGLRLCRLADWNQVAADWRFFLASSPDGCRVAVDQTGGVIGTVATIAYGTAFSWIGMVLVDPEHRRRGIGTRLLHEALTLVGDETAARLDATPAGRAVYVPLGFHDEYELQRLVRTPGHVDVQPTVSVREISDADFGDVLTFDREVFGADRSRLLNRLRNEAPEYTRAIGATRLEGYVFGRHGHSFEHIGPLVAIDEAQARRLVSACVSAHPERPFVIDAPRRAGWISWLESEGFRPQRHFMRMRRGEQRYCDWVDPLFAIAGPEFG
jgi:GNAT superfamily N-acetyltransferase